ncbi:pyridoxal phosphate-dependent aminotransferase [Candidatus Woesearchaeota archaeon]|nr:pyridoxal phosphate-dependent aminotransferase [Candidatus Woesearchaeota archaeon]
MEHTIDSIPISTIDEVIRRIAREKHIVFSRVTIREIDLIRRELVTSLGLEMAGMDMGIPGLPTPEVIIEAQKAAVNGANCSLYAPFDGLPVLKEATAQFLNAYLGITVEPKNCIPTVGGMHGCKVNIGIVGRLNKERDTILFLVPGFSVNSLQALEYGIKTENLDTHGKYGSHLVDAIEERARKGNVAGIMWSSPNNPTWRVLSERELEGIGKILTQYDIIGIEDAAYLGLDSRMKERRTPGENPYFPTIANYTELWAMVISASKIFNFAGERVGTTILSETVAKRKSKRLLNFFSRDNYWDAFVQGGLYSSVASVSRSAQHAFAVGLTAATNPSSFNYFEYDRPYETRAQAVKGVLLRNGFTIPYDRDDYGKVGDGYYFTAAHPAFEKGERLAFSLLQYGMTAVPLVGFGGTRNEGVRICCSKVDGLLLEKLEERARLFNETHSS